MNTALAALIALAFASAAFAADVHVRVDPAAPHANPGQENLTTFPTIQNALDHHPFATDGGRVYIEIAPGTYREFGELSSIKESRGVPAAEDMIRELVAGQEAVVKTARAVFPLVDEVHDEPSADLLTQRMHVHEKTAWMLRSLLA